MERNDRDDENGDNQRYSWSAAIAVAGVLTAGVAYLMKSKQKQTESAAFTEPRSEPPPPRSREHPKHAPSILSNLINRINDCDSWDIVAESSRGRIESIPLNPIINNLNALLSDIYVRYVAVKRNDFYVHYKIFNEIFYTLHSKMKEVDTYYNRYSSTVQFAGSHSDSLRIKKPDEFDMDVVIGLPLNIKNDPCNVEMNDIVIEPSKAGFVNLKMGVQYLNLPFRDGTDWEINKTAYRWKDENGYMTRSKFIDWFKSVVIKALQRFKQNMNKAVFMIDWVTYTITTSESGPAVTLIIKNVATNFLMSIDLVPALKFPESRWPIDSAYRVIPERCKKGYWMVVPKPDKSEQGPAARARGWRAALHCQERELLRGTNHLRQAIRLTKKFRDAQRMDKICSYYIKTVALWQVVDKNNITFWRRSPAELFVLIVRQLHAAVVAGKIAYFWNPNNNLLEGVSSTVLANYEYKLRMLLNVLESPADFRNVATHLLTVDELKEYQKTILCKV